MKFRGSVGALAFSLALLTPLVAAAATTVTFTATGSQQTWVVPAGVTSVTIEAFGAQGGANWLNNTNFGGSATGKLAVTPGAVLYVYVGSQPVDGVAGGFNGGGDGATGGKGGGGASDVRVGGNALANRVIVAGGGGGAGFWSNLHVVGGVGGGLTGGNGLREPNDAGGLGATQSAGGANGTCVTFNVTSLAGSLGQGGSPSGLNCGCEGYGGGGGYYGGAGSGNCRGGGGGSGYIGGVTDGSMQSGVRQGSGEVRFTYTVSQAPQAVPVDHPLLLALLAIALALTAIRRQSSSKRRI